MSKRLIWIPQYPTKMRYQSWFFRDFYKEFEKRFEKVYVLGYKYITEIHVNKAEKSQFSPIKDSIYFECIQIQEYMDLDIDINNDILLHMDLSFPGLFHNVLFHKRPKKCFCYVHATSKNEHDYFSKDFSYKFPIETFTSALYNKVFVSTNYHRKKLKWNNIELIGLPFPNLKTFKNNEKIYDIISVSRPTKQKVDFELETEINQKYNLFRKECDTWEEYYNFIGQSKIMILSAREETFGYAIIDAILNNCIPLAPNRCSYPELLSDSYIYRSREDLFEKLDNILNKHINIDIPILKNVDIMNNFYDNLYQKIIE